MTTSSFPHLNEPAPNFKALTTDGERSLADYKGKWLILFSHPADFTPVCTTEFIGFAKAAGIFKTMNCELLGLSIDSVFSHLAWTQNIKEKFGVEIPFPIIEDIKMEVAGAYGMVHPGAADTQAVRATFFIDPNGVLRAMVYYPMSNGRSINEFVRLLQAMHHQHGGRWALRTRRRRVGCAQVCPHGHPARPARAAPGTFAGVGRTVVRSGSGA